MQRPATSIVILAWNAWDQTKACLESLRPTLGVRDQVIVVDNGSRDATPSMLRQYGWLEVVTNQSNQGFATGCNQGAAQAVHDTVVFLNNDTVLTGHWLDALLSPLTDETVGAVGPRSNFVSGTQVAEGASYPFDDKAAMRRFARQWASDHRGQVTEVNRLVGFCLAVRRRAFLQIGGFDDGYAIGGFEDDDLCRRLTGLGLRLVIAHESFVHHAGHKTFDANGVDWFAQQELNAKRFEAKFGSVGADPLVSACLITKDEADNLPSCLGSLDGLADEIVVYDTGSSDNTVAVARSLGATVIEGYWDDDFSRARNAALAHCHGTWVAWLDADETAVCADRSALRRLLSTAAPEIDGFAVPIDNLTGSGINSLFIHSATRLFRRARCEWTGRLHEQIAGRNQHRPIVSCAVDGYRLRHTGYLDMVMTSRGKVERNLRVAAAEVADNSSWDQGFSLVSLGRSYLTAGRREEAIEHCRHGYDVTRNAVTRRLALRTIAEALLDGGRAEEAEAEITRLRDASTNPILADLLTVRLHLARGQYHDALAAYDAIRWYQRDDDGFEYDPAMYVRFRVEALVRLERFGAAADALLEILSTTGMLDLHLGALIDYLQQAGRPLSEISDVLPREQRHLLLAQVLQLKTAVADDMLEACWERIDADLLLATAASLAHKLPLQRQLVWSARLRQHGFGQICPLLITAGDEQALPTDRVRAAAVALAAFGDERARPAFHAAAATLVGTAQRIACRHEVAALAPALLADFDQATPRPENCRSCWPDATGGAYGASLVLVTPGDRERTEACIQRIAEITAPEAYEMIVVGNGADDATAELGRALSGDVSYVHLGHRRNTYEAFHAGAERARGWATVLLTTSIDVQPGWLVGLLDALGSGAAAAGPVVVGADHVVFSAGITVQMAENGLLDLYGCAHGQQADALPAGPAHVPTLGGAGLAVRTDALAAVGGLDRAYSSDFGAADLCLRLVEAGEQVVVSGSSQLLQRIPDVPADQAERVHRDAQRFTARWNKRIDCIPDAAATSVRDRDLPPTSPTGSLAWEQEVPSYYGHERPEVVALVPLDAAHVLDIGCAAGRLGAAIKRRQPCHVLGVELDSLVAKQAQKQLDDVRVLDLNRDTLELEDN